MCNPALSDFHHYSCVAFIRFSALMYRFDFGLIYFPSFLLSRFVALSGLLVLFRTQQSKWLTVEKSNPIYTIQKKIRRRRRRRRGGGGGGRAQQQQPK